MNTAIVHCKGTTLAFLVLAAALAPRLQAQISVIGGLSHDLEVRPGEAITGTVMVKNDTNIEQEAKVYQTDYSFRSDGSNHYGEAGSMARSNARWLSFAPSFVTIPPQSTVTVNYTVTVPPDSGIGTLSGSYWSMLMVQAVSPGSAESTAKKADAPTMGLRQTIRYGVQIATHIRGTGQKAVRFLDARMVKRDSGERFLEVDLENSGDLFFRPNVHVEFFDADGQSRATIRGSLFRMYPGTSVRQAFSLVDVAAGTYKVLVVVDAGGEDVFGAQYTMQW